MKRMGWVLAYLRYVLCPRAHVKRQRTCTGTDLLCRQGLPRCTRMVLRLCAAHAALQLHDEHKSRGPAENLCGEVRRPSDVSLGHKRIPRERLSLRDGASMYLLTSQYKCGQERRATILRSSKPYGR